MIEDFGRKNIVTFCIALFIVLSLISLASQYHGSTDIGDYADAAKYFAGKYNADIRNSHSYLYGFLHAPLLVLFDSFIFLKISGLVALAAIIFSVYWISEKDKKSLILISLCPAVWYIGAWINPIQIASLCLIWAYFFIKKFNEGMEIRNAAFAGALIGLGMAFWMTIIYFAFIMFLLYFLDKKFYAFLVFGLGALVGFAPQFLLDWYIFGFPLYSLIKTMSGTFLIMLSGGIYSTGGSSFDFLSLLLVLLTIPYSFWKLLIRRLRGGENWRGVLFVALVILVIVSNSQLRYMIVIAPISILLLRDKISEKTFKRQVVIYSLVSLLFVLPVTLQIDSGLTENPYGAEITFSLKSLSNLDLSSDSARDLLITDLEDLEKEYPGEVFLVGNEPDDYQTLAHFYWGDDIIEFVSIQDYEIEMSGDNEIYGLDLEIDPNIRERRKLWISGGISKNEDETDYTSIAYALSLYKPFENEQFSVVKKYNILYLSKRSN